MTGSLEGRVIVVTGAAAGIGRGILRACLAEGATVAGLDNAADGNARITEAGGLWYRADVADPSGFTAALGQVRANLGRIDGLVNNAGVTRIAPFLDADLEAWETLWRVNQRSVLIGSQAVARIMVEDGTKGAIVNIASNHATASDVGYEGYAGTKGAIAAMTRAMAWSLGPHGIRANTLSPGLTMTEAVERAASDPDRAAAFGDWHANGTVNSVDDIGRVAAFLLSDASAALTGAEIVADQGMASRLAALGFSEDDT